MALKVIKLSILLHQCNNVMMVISKIVRYKIRKYKIREIRWRENKINKTMMIIIMIIKMIQMMIANNKNKK